ncbi:MAG TPA: hydrogenase nickel incorporation protein HypB [Syntrophales bacterium]|nr:hydrogenase nickel incorporation protein HypB [Syntrophales bacterium]HQN78487.1 hydrogenase nickel incorporation protein HypB [Syntrophales bacterium]HQQ27372.1 hydrogenase nickel incorporation protein HypB [Syntrophales bacterium]
MENIRLIEVREEILSDNRDVAREIRETLRRKGVFLLNLMSSPGAGKTSLLIRTLRALRDAFRIAVIEGDIDSMVDAEKAAAEGVPAVQIRTGSACHLDAPMVEKALGELDLDRTDLVLMENVGNLVCPAEFDTGDTRKAMILSVPEGDDKPLKYPLMFSICHAVVVNKTDCFPMFDFDLDVFRERVRKLNPGAEIFPLSCKTGEGMDRWIAWLEKAIAESRSR